MVLKLINEGMISNPVRGPETANPNGVPASETTAVRDKSNSEWWGKNKIAAQGEQKNMVRASPVAEELRKRHEAAAYFFREKYRDDKTGDEDYIDPLLRNVISVFQ